MTSVIKIISGGQTGADRGGLDAAIALGIPHGGWCPAGRVAEDGPIPMKYNLTETVESTYPPRTRLNVLNSDATVVFRVLPSAGCRLTMRLAGQLKKPFFICGIRDEAGQARVLSMWLAGIKPAVLNVAGHREHSCPGIRGATERILIAALTRRS